MMLERQSSEKGQALVLIVLAMVVLLGFTALAVDGGMVYSDRRHAQNASDAASLAGGSAAALDLENSHVTYSTWNCGNSVIGEARDDAEAAAIVRAGDNGFSIDRNVTDHHGVTTDCDSEIHGAWTEKFIDITTEISTTTPTSFAHFVYSGKLQSRVKSVTRIRPRASLGFGNSIVALNEEQSCSGGTPNGVVFDGNVEVQVTGGGIFSNGCIQANGATFDVDVVGGVSFTWASCKRTMWATSPLHLMVATACYCRILLLPFQPLTAMLRAWNTLLLPRAMSIETMQARATPSLIPKKSDREITARSR